jgi:hypothetical protein
LVGSSISDLPFDCDVGGFHPFYDVAPGGKKYFGVRKGWPHSDRESDFAAGGSDPSRPLSVGTPSLFISYDL